ncbi:hypothetical protein SAMN05428950_1011009 [Sphingomonas sp. OV641]|uniref:hypothetical protein n=1 Tax=Sphingomonas sp. OV641 TaxID=1881068 RepID=UPI0008AE1B09|nr:hypothetical protein [Sphingomonas sp. OV641]SEJ06403.1 hypothetical protein SAMN05428950_1011009 [Sphingomonas sp. OV641]
MSEHDRQLRRLRFDLDVLSDESVPGAIARGVAENHLVKLNVVLKEIGIGRYAGASQLADTATLDRLATVLRCDPERLRAQAGRRLVEPGDRRLQHFLDFDGLVVPRGHLELARRRISPLSLARSPHHRQSWLMSVLPFCPESLECLIDSCSHCGKTLGWVQSVGIGRCENCLRPIEPNPIPPLSDDLAEDYRIFAGLLSLIPEERDAARSIMPDRLKDLSPGALARLAMRCGLDCDDGEEKRAWQTRAGRMRPERLALTAVRGVALLRSWPNGILNWATQRVAAASDEKGCRADMARRIRRIAWGDSRFDDQRDLVQEAFPGFAPPRVGLAGGGRVYTGRQANRVLPGFRTQAETIRRLRIVPTRAVASHGIMLEHAYSAVPIDAAAARWADSVPISTIASRLRLPLYAVEQLIETDLLARHDDEILAIILRRPQAVASTFEAFVRRLTERASRKRMPSTALPIGQESRRIGGRPKPWSEIYAALLDDRIPFWLDGDVDTDRLLVARGSLDRFIVASEPKVFGSNTPFATQMSTGDAAELLNVRPAVVAELSSAGVITRTKGLRAMMTPRIGVERLAAKLVSAAELARRARTSAEQVNDRLRAAGFVDFHGFWRRREVLDLLPLR